MISQAQVRKLIDDIESHYQQCWDTLCSIKNRDVGDLDGNSVLAFQPTLAQCLFDLDEMYRALHQERRAVIGKKDLLSEDWFCHRLGLIQHYQDCLREVIAIGKALGDAFAWLHYSLDRRCVEEHWKHKPIFHTPPGIGGKGELEFIKRVPMIHGHFVVYHGITTFLRFGDVSIFDLKRKRLYALGEIKTEKTSPGELSISLSIIGPADESGVLPKKPPQRSSSIDDLVSPTLPPQMAQKLKRQLREMIDCFDVPKPHETSKIYGDCHFDRLKRVLENVNRSSAACQVVGSGLLLIGLEDGKKTLSRRLMKRSSEEFIKKLDLCRKYAPQIAAPESEHNGLMVYSWNCPSPNYQLQIGMTPFFWWPLAPELLHKVVFREALVFAAYNPAHFITKLESIGFNVRISRNSGEFIVTRVCGDKTIQVGNFGYFLSLVIFHLFSEDAVVNMINHLTSSIESKVESGELPDYAKVDLRIQQHL